MFSDIAILAGGFGERLWPASRPDFPKQFLSISNGISFLQNAVLRAVALRPSGKIVIATRRGLEEEIASQCLALAKSVPADDREKIMRDVLVLAEPAPRHTAAPVLLCCHLLNKIAPQEKHTLLVLASDHIIDTAGQFAADAEKAFRAAEAGRFVCFGIQPDEPSTGYGYIQAGAPAGCPGVLEIDSFKEKPDEKTARAYLKAGNCLWNSGMFAFSCDFFISEMKACTPEIADAFERLPSGSAPQFGSIRGISCVAGWQEMDDAYTKTPATAIDVAVAEKTRRACVVPASFSWDDVGSWDSFAKHSDGEGDAALIESTDDFIYSDIPVAVCGVSGISVIIKNGKALVMKKGASPLVREAASYFSGKN